MTVLLADDDPDQLYVRRLLLEQHGFKVFAASDRATALDTMRHEHPRCALIDLNLPAEADGLALIRDLKASDPRLPILLLTGRRAKHLASHPELLLVDAIFEKGRPSRELLERLLQFST